jgi:hypothetical protein
MSRPTLVKADALPQSKPCPFSPEQVAWLMELLDRRDEVERGRERAFLEEVRSGLLLVAGAVERRYAPRGKKNPT